jgi:hypothetical protein
MEMHNIDIPLGASHLRLLAGIALGMGAMLGLWYLLLGKKMISMPYSYVG